MSILGQTAELAILLKLRNEVTGPLKQIERDLGKLGNQATGVQGGITKIGAGLGVGLVRSAALAAAGVSAVGTAFIASAKLAGDFEAQLHTINTVAGLSQSQLTKVGDSLRKVARDTGVDLADLTSGYYDLVSAGIKAADAQDILNDAVKLGIGGLATTTEAVNLMTTAVNVYHLDVAGAAKATDMFAQAVADGQVKAGEIASSFADIGPVAKNFGVGIDQIAASYALLTANGVPAGEVATQMQRAIISLINPTKDLEDAQKKLGVVFATEITKKGLVPALQEVREYSERTGIPLNDLLGRIEGVQYLLNTTGPNLQTFNAELAKMGTSSGIAARQMAERQQGLNYEIARLKTNLKDLGITVGTIAIPRLANVLHNITEFLSSPEVQQGATKLADGIAGIFSDKNIAEATRLAKDVLPSIAAGLRITAAAAKTAYDIFNGLPPELKAVAVAALVGNKLTGGLVASGIGDIGKALVSGAVKGVLGMNAGVVNIQAGVVNGAGGVGAAAGGGLATVVTKIVPIALIAASIAGIAQQTADAVSFKQQRENLQQKSDLTNAEALALQLQQRGGLGSLDARSAQGAVTAFMNEHTTYEKALVSALDKLAGGTGAASHADLQAPRDPAIQAGLATIAAKLEVANATSKDDSAAFTQLSAAITDTQKRIEAKVAKPSELADVLSEFAGHFSNKEDFAKFAAAITDTQNRIAAGKAKPSELQDVLGEFASHFGVPIAKLAAAVSALGQAQSRLLTPAFWAQGEKAIHDAFLAAQGKIRTGGKDTSALLASIDKSTAYFLSRSTEYYKKGAGANVLLGEIALLTKAQTQATKNGDKTTAAAIGKDIAALKTKYAELTGKTNAEVAAAKKKAATDAAAHQSALASVAAKLKTANDKLTVIEAKKTDITVTTPPVNVDTSVNVDNQYIVSRYAFDNGGSSSSSSSSSHTSGGGGGAHIVAAAKGGLFRGGALVRVGENAPELLEFFPGGGGRVTPESGPRRDPLAAAISRLQQSIANFGRRSAEPMKPASVVPVNVSLSVTNQVSTRDVSRSTVRIGRYGPQVVGAPLVG